MSSSSSSSSSATATASSSSSYEDKEENFTVVMVPSLDDNYGYLIHDGQTGMTAAVDTPDAAMYKHELENRGWTLSHILNTHHHWDHTGGNTELQNDANGALHIFGPATETIPGMTHPVNGGDKIELGDGGTLFRDVEIIDVGGHTNGHIAYYFPHQNMIFVGDSLFVLGCGRMFEGTPSQNWKSLKRLRSLPDSTVVYCAHEYTIANAKFAISVEPNNTELQTRYEQFQKLRSQSIPTVPTTIGEEKRTNPFFRGDISPEIRTNVGWRRPENDNDNDDEVSSSDGASIFAKIRKAKDRF